jgi:hypothetical protein
VRTSADYARICGLSYATLFVDIKAAFASTLRELVMPQGADDECHVTALLCSRGFPSVEAKSIVAEGLHAQLWGNTSPHLRHLVAALSTHQHIVLDYLAGALDVKVGLLAGLSLADLCFAIGISRVTKTVRALLIERDLLWYVDSTLAAEQFGGERLPIPERQILIAETSIVDDVAYPVASSAVDIISRVAQNRDHRY